MSYSKDSEVLEILKENKITFNVLDVGASGTPYQPFERIKHVAKVFLTDPDSREFDSQAKDGKIRIPKAIINNDVDNEVELFLTKNPYYSSTLKPDMSRISNFSYPTSWLEVERTTKLPATSVNRLVKEYNIEGFDWIKLDTQGTELKILKSMNEEVFAKTLCVDLEISLYAHYINADTLSEGHSFMEQRKFWISDIQMHNRLRMRRSDLDELINHTWLFKKIIKPSLEINPTTFEARYVRSINKGDDFTVEHGLKLWAINYFAGNYSYCFYLSNMMIEKYNSPLGQKMKKISTDLLFSYRRMFRQLALNTMFEIKRKIW